MLINLSNATVFKNVQSKEISLEHSITINIKTRIFVSHGSVESSDII